MMAIVERDMRKFFRSPALMMAAMVFPLVQLIVLGNAFGGKIHDARLGIVAHDNGPQAIRVLEALRAIESNPRTFKTVLYNDEREMVNDVRKGHLNAGLVIPPQFSRNLYEHARPQIGLVIDSYGLVSVALARRSAADELRLQAPTEVSLEPAAG